MVIMAARARGFGRSSITVPLVALILAATVSGALTFAVVGAAGKAFPHEARGLITIVASFTLLCAVLRGTKPLQRDAETPEGWLEPGGLRVALWNGLALGAGFITRIGFWLWWILPLLTFARASVVFGVLLGAVYGFTRLSLSSLVAAESVITRSDFVARRSLARRKDAEQLDRPLFVAAVGLTLVTAVKLLVGPA